jgi:hypothetical protein
MVVGKSWYIRLYLWLYEASINHITTCKIFWAFAFLPLAILPALLLKGVRFVGRAISFSINNYAEAQVQKSVSKFIEQEKARPVKTEPGWWEKFFGAIDTVVAGTRMRVRPHWPMIKTVFLILFFIGVVATLVGILIADPIVFLKMIGFIVGFIAAVFGVVYAMAGFFWLLERNGTRETGRFIKRVYYDIHQNTCAKVEVKSDDYAHSR